MGTAVWIDKAQFRMSAAGESQAVAALKQAFPSEHTFVSRGIHEKPSAYRDLVNATSLAGALRCVMGLGEHVVVQELPDGGVSGLGREGMMDDLPARAIARFFQPIAGFVLLDGVSQDLAVVCDHEHAVAHDLLTSFQRQRSYFVHSAPLIFHAKCGTILLHLVRR